MTFWPEAALIALGWGLGVGTSVVAWAIKKRSDHSATEKIHDYLTKEYTGKDGQNEFASTRMIAANCNLSDIRVRELCATDERIRPSVGSSDDDLWGLLSVVGPAKPRKKLKPGFLGEPLPPNRL